MKKKKKLILIIFVVLAVVLVAGGLLFAFSGDEGNKGNNKGNETNETEKDNATDEYDFACSLEVEKFDGYTVNYVEYVYLDGDTVVKSVPKVVLRFNDKDCYSTYKSNDSGDVKRDFNDKDLTVSYANGKETVYQKENEEESINLLAEDYKKSYTAANYVCK